MLMFAIPEILNIFPGFKFILPRGHCRIKFHLNWFSVWSEKVLYCHRHSYFHIYNILNQRLSIKTRCVQSTGELTWLLPEGTNKTRNIILFQIQIFQYGRKLRTFLAQKHHTRVLNPLHQNIIKGIQTERIISTTVPTKSWGWTSTAT